MEPTYKGFDAFLSDIQGKPEAYVQQACNHEYQSLEPLTKLPQRQRANRKAEIEYYCLLRDFVDMMKGTPISPMQSRAEARKRMVETIESIRSAEREIQEGSKQQG